MDQRLHAAVVTIVQTVDYHDFSVETCFKIDVLTLPNSLWF